MFMQSGISQYRRIEGEIGVVEASPHKLILLLMEGALTAIRTAKQKMIAHEIAEKGAALSKAIAIIGEGLRVSIDKEAGGELAENLDALYEYMCNRLLTANLHNDPDILDEVHGLLFDIKGAWEQIGPSSNAPDGQAQLQE